MPLARPLARALLPRRRDPRAPRPLAPLVQRSPPKAALAATLASGAGLGVKPVRL